ncbi:unnamed protein product, partial [Aphanomyces euteiches]
LADDTAAFQRRMRLLQIRRVDRAQVLAPVERRRLASTNLLTSFKRRCCSMISFVNDTGRVNINSHTNVTLLVKSFWNAKSTGFDVIAQILPWGLITSTIASKCGGRSVKTKM